MAHGFLQSFDKRITVCSAGTNASGKLNSKAVAVMAEIGIDISHHTSDSVEKYLGEERDYVLPIVVELNESCPVFLGQVNIACRLVSDDHRKPG
jgi:arsenate reductase